MQIRADLLIVGCEFFREFAETKSLIIRTSVEEFVVAFIERERFLVWLVLFVAISVEFCQPLPRVRPSFIALRGSGFVIDV